MQRLAAPRPDRSAPSSLSGRRWRRLLVDRRKPLLAGAVALLAVGLAASHLGDEPLRRRLEQGVNRQLKGYTASIGHAHLSPFGLSLTLRDVSVVQQANPEPPVIAVPFLQASVHWRELLTLHLVADFRFDRPKVHVNRPQLMKEADDAVPVKERGWQEALESLYPLKINLLHVDGGDLTYIDDETSEPLRVTDLRVRATNIRNTRSRDHVYPSPLEVTGTILGTGRGSLRGHASFLAEPHPGIHVLFDLARVPLKPFRPLVERSNLSVRDGVVSTSGELELAPSVRLVHVRELVVRKVKVDYLHSRSTSAKEKQRVEKVKEAVRVAADSPRTDLRLGRLEITESELGFVDRARDPAYRLYLSEASITATNVSNGLRAGPADVQIAGKFMGTGRTEAKATFRPDGAGPDFDVAVSIHETAMPPMNDLLRAYGRFDVTAGVFSFFSELTVRKGTVDGYVKPLFRDVRVYDARQDSDKNLFRRLYEKVVGGVSKLLQNRPRDEVATKTRLRGPIENPHANVLEVVLRLLQNAFVQAILPGFDAELRRSGLRRPPTEKRTPPSRHPSSGGS